MPTLRTRSLILAALLAPSALLVGAVRPGLTVPAAPRVPSEAVLTVDGWQAGDALVNLANGNAYLVRSYARQGAPLTFELTTGPTGKTVYRASPTVPYLGNGYTVEAAPASVTDRLAPGESAFVARSVARAWLEVHAYGERRGVVGNLIAGWALVAFDLLLGRPNDYYLERVVAPLDADPAGAVELAHGLFPRVSAWYEATT
ncbi:MAG: exosortase-associated EpsI family protein [Chloroflexi bacterium]|nr:exosortase-associated EpsI family protein [Chloroflexota bacterium]